jgi:anti-sigma regulatory factor (Ser/Thr protein kinase)
MRRMRTFPAIPQSVHAARRFATDALIGCPAPTVEAVELLVSELATNCIRHERTSFHITILRSGQEIRVEVTDSGAGTPSMRSPGPNEPSGRGLQIVDMLSGSWGVQPEKPSGKTVWFTLADSTGAERESEQVTAPAAEQARFHRAPEVDPEPVGGGPPIVQSREDAPECPTSRVRRVTARDLRPRRPVDPPLTSQGPPALRRYCHHDELGCNARRRPPVRHPVDCVR